MVVKFDGDLRRRVLKHMGTREGLRFRARLHRRSCEPSNHLYHNKETFARGVVCLTRKESVDSATAFASYKEALDWRMKNRQCSQNIDNLVPTVPEQKRALFRDLFKAFESIMKKQ